MTESSTQALRVVFMGTPDFALPALSGLVDAGYRIVGVLTRPDRRAGRGRRAAKPPIKAFAEEQGLSIFQPASLKRDAEAREQIASLAPDVIVVAAYGAFLPDDTLAVPRLGCLNIHPSLLPRHRGPSPVPSAILAGDEVTGVSVMLLDSGMDSGPILAQRPTPIGPLEYRSELTPRLFRMGAGLLIETLPGWASGEVKAQPQDDAAATITKLLDREDGRIDWTGSAQHVGRQIRAFDPWPGTHTMWRGKSLKILTATPSKSTPASRAAGEVVELTDGGIGVVTGDGVLELTTVQIESKRPAPVGEFVQGYRDFVGSRLDSL
ncbi:MAG: methionyl-tRNA formyltransferase [SAR202 cluster bacterium]|nr:methionyl-tRNA formyltransferase [SAR202 cluster bacterium]MDP6662867.1 methionyl-tRNA formyltransferase [SAR202 cluster bacterium]MDP6799675.1 methionyl-tRNA formyltransferase [SAR202 cluster bacterium]